MNIFVVTVATFLLILQENTIIEGKTLERVERAEPKYTTKYDNIDVDRILQSRRLILSYIKCLLETGPCSPDGRELKKYVPDALATNCVKCSEIQKKQAGKIFSFILLNYRKEWDELIAKYDPDGNYRKMYHVDEDYDYSDLDEARK